MILVYQGAAAIVGYEGLLDVPVIVEILVSLQCKSAYVNGVGVNAVLLEFVSKIGTEVCLTILA